MKKLAPLAFLCAALIPMSAMAMTNGVPKAVRVAGLNAGTLTPFLLQQSGAFCRYSGVWGNELGNDSVECDLFEQRVVGASSCITNAAADINTTVIAGDGLGPCTGYDQFGRDQGVAFMVLGESAGGNDIGTVTYLGIPSGPYSLELIP